MSYKILIVANVLFLALAAACFVSGFEMHWQLTELPLILATAAACVGFVPRQWAASIECIVLLFTALAFAVSTFLGGILTLMFAMGSSQASLDAAFGEAGALFLLFVMCMVCGIVAGVASRKKKPLRRRLEAW